MAGELCTVQGCYSFGRYCRIDGHNSKPKQLEKKIPEVKPIPKVSEKRKVLNKEYSKVSKPLWEGKPCAINSPECSGWAQGWNHSAGKENKEKLLDMENGQPACNACNTYCESHHAWAVKNGFRNQRNTATKRYEHSFAKVDNLILKKLSK